MICPLSKSIILSHTSSISFKSWVVSITVVFFSLFISFIKVLIFSFTSTSKPIVGSSKYTILGLCRNVAAISHLIFCPKLKFLTCFCNNGSNSSISLNFFRFCLYSPSGILYIFLISLKDSITGKSHHSCVFWPNTAPIFLLFSILFWLGFKLSTTTSPEVGVKSPVSILIVVDFPAPFSPMYPISSPSCISKFIWFTAVNSLYFGFIRFLKYPISPSSFSIILYVFTKSLTSIIAIFIPLSSF